MTIRTLTLEGHIPSKKNMLRRSKNGGMFRDKSVTAEIDALTLQVKAQWRSNYVVRPRLSFMFYLRDMRGDLDNKLTTVLDCMTAGGVFASDNLKNVNQFAVNGEVDKDERVIIRIEED